MAGYQRQFPTGDDMYDSDPVERALEPDDGKGY